MDRPRPESKVVSVNSWSELPRELEPGVYLVNGERIVVRERVSRDALERTITIMKERRGKYV